MPACTVRRAGPADAAVLNALFDGYRVFYRQPSEPGRVAAFVAERLTRGDSVFLLAEDGGGRGLGFVQLYPSFSSVAMRPIWILNDLFVAEAGRGHGAGRALMEAARAHAEVTGALRLELTTETGNTAAQRLYRACGYTHDDAFLIFRMKVA